MTPDAPPRTTLRPDAAGAGLILVLGTSGDPTTPIEDARRAVEELERAAALTLEADHHLAYLIAVRDPRQPSHRCVLDAVESYLIDLELPAKGTVCGPGVVESDD